MILAVCAFAAAILLIGFIAGTWWMEKKAEQEYLAMQEKNAEKRQKVPEEEKKIDIPVDFDSLQKENPDIYAWITIPDTVIDYPIVQSSEDNAYYLNHSAEKTDSVSGAIYSENYNKKNFDDPITLLYGHNMKDGSMFAGLHKYEEDTYYIKRIIGLPGETDAMLLEQVAAINSLPLTTLKFHQLQLFRGTAMAAEYDADPGRFRFWEIGEYIDLFVEVLRRLRPDLVVERFASEAPPRYHYGRNWGLVRNEQLLAMLEKRLEERNAYQGEIFVSLQSL